MDFNNLKALPKYFAYSGKALNCHPLGHTPLGDSLKDLSISEYQARYATSIVAKYLDNAIVKVSTNFYRTTFPLCVDR